MTLDVAILAGGLGSRLGPIAACTPKALLEVAGKPFAHHQLELLRHWGCERVVMCVGHMGERIAEALGDGDRFGLRVRYSFDGPELLGTAGALRQALALLGEAFLVLYGDTYLTCDFRQVECAFLASRCLGMMTVLRNQGCWEPSNVRLMNGKIVAYDKHNPTPDMLHIDYGLGAFRAEALGGLAQGQHADLSELQHTLAQQGQLAAFEVEERFHEIGSAQGLRETADWLAAQGRDR